MTDAETRRQKDPLAHYVVSPKNGHLPGCRWDDATKRYDCVEGCEILAINRKIHLVAPTGITTDNVRADSETRQRLIGIIEWHCGSIAVDGSLCSGAIQAIKDNMLAILDERDMQIKQLQEENTRIKERLADIQKGIDYWNNLWERMKKENM